MNSADRDSYAQAGVDIEAADKAKELIKRLARSTSRPEVLTDIGLFGGMFQLAGYNQPVLVSSADGVGTKLKVAALLGKHDTIGIDLVNHCVNDIFTCGASPLFFLDYIAMGKLIPEKVESIATEATTRGQVIGLQIADMGEDDVDASPWLRSPSRKPKHVPIDEPIPRNIQAVMSQRLYVEKAGLPSALR